MTRSTDTKRPSWAKMIGEVSTIPGLLALQLAPPRLRGTFGNGLPVLVIPGLFASDFSTMLLRRTLKACGFRAFGWHQGINLGARRGSFAKLLKRVDDLFAREQRPLAVVGWSLGGLYARELAKQRPDKVSLVVTMGTPFSHLRLVNTRALYEAINDHPVDCPPIAPHPAEKPAQRTVAIWSKRDGIVAPASASGHEHETDETVEVRCRHLQMGTDREPLEAIVAALREESEKQADERIPAALLAA